MTDAAHETSAHIAKLEQEIAELKRKRTRVFTVLDIATAKKSFLRLMISLDATETQESDVYVLTHGRGGRPALAGHGGD